MRLSLRGRMARVLASVGLSRPSLIIPAAAPVGGGRNPIIRVGTDQDLEVAQPVALGHGRRLRDLHAQLRPARRVRPEPRAGPRLRRVVDAARPTG